MTAVVLPLKKGGQLRFRPLGAAEVPAAAALEAASYPADEAASPESLEFRQREAGPYFYGAFDGDGSLCGFICGTVAPGLELKEESMAEHHPDGPTLCIHSVVVSEALRRQGAARGMLDAYVQAVRSSNRGLRRIALIAKARLLRLYVGAGFRVEGLSAVTHGRDPWFDLSMELDGERMLQVDAFAVPGKPYSGNPAAVVFTQRGGDEAWMQMVANENSLSETAYLEGAAGGGRYGLRWFTPTTEVDLCGHATLAAAHALWYSARESGDAIAFDTKSGELLARRVDGGAIELDFPVSGLAEGLSAEEEDTVRRAFGLADKELLYCGRSDFDIFVEVTGDAFWRLGGGTDLGLVQSLACRGVSITAQGGPPTAPAEYDFSSRWFGPQSGVPEDPVTGSAHCARARYWKDKLGKADGEPMLALQASARQGRLVVRREGDRVRIAGAAVTTVDGTLCREDV